MGSFLASFKAYSEFKLQPHLEIKHDNLIQFCMYISAYKNSPDFIVLHGMP